MPYYNNLITTKSWQVLQQVNKEFSFVLIGGWAVWLYTEGLKSKDIDIIVDYQELEKFKEKYDLVKNDRLKKYEVKTEGVSIDIYVSYYSDLGIPAEEAIKSSHNFKGFQVMKKEALLVLKQKAHEGRRLSLKGRKDMIDIFSLILLPDFDWALYKQLVEKYHLEDYVKGLKELIEKTREIKELNINRHQYSRSKKELLNKLK